MCPYQLKIIALYDVFCVDYNLLTTSNYIVINSVPYKKYDIILSTISGPRVIVKLRKYR